MHTTEQNPFDKTRITWRLWDERNPDVPADWQHVVTAKTETPEREDSSQYVCYLTYPTESAKRNAIRSRRLGRHEGNILIVFTEENCMVAPVYMWRNSATIWESFTPDNDAYIREKALAIPVEMAKRIHPRAFADMYRSALQAYEQDHCPIPLTCQEDPDYHKWVRRAEWNEACRLQGAELFKGAEPQGFPTDHPTFGDGSEITA